MLNRQKNSKISKIIFLTELGDNSGYGHINRCLSLSEGFKTYNIDSEFIISAENECKIQNLSYKNINWNIKFITSNFICSSEHLYIIDTYKATNDILIKINEFFPNVVFIIDSQLKFPLGCNVFFPSIYANNFLSIKSKVKNFIGGRQYLLLSKELEKFKFEIRKDISKIGISIGGGINNVNLIIKIIKTIYPEKEIFVFSQNKETKCINNVKFLGFLSKSKYLNEILKLDLIITNGGISLNEIIALKIPAISLILNKSQKLNAFEWNKIIGLEVIDFDIENYNIKLKDCLKKMKSEFFRQNYYSDIFINHDGSRRAANEILKLFYE